MGDRKYRSKLCETYRMNLFFLFELEFEKESRNTMATLNTIESRGNIMF